jgi:predicted GIY-YIG superfamily endonuclease
VAAVARVVVLEIVDVKPRIRADRPNLYIGVTTRTASELAEMFATRKGRPAWVRGNVVRVRADLAPDVTVDRELAVELRDDLIRRLRTKGYTVNRNTTAYRTYVINLHNPNLADPGKGYVYVGQTSKTPQERLVEHLTGAVSAKGTNLASRVVKKYGVDLNHDLMTQKIYLTKNQAIKAERRLAERLRQQGYVVEGGH